MRYLIKLFFALMITGNALSQDFHYSQFYAAPLLLNPALTGSTELSRVGLNYRKQWPGLQFDFNAYSAYFDHYSMDLNSGFGMGVNSFQEANMNLKTTDVSLYYAYNLKVTDSWNFRLGTQVSFNQRSGNLDNIVFGDQINLFDRSINLNTIDIIPEFDNIFYSSISFGGLINNDFLWLGTSFHHINNPNLSFFPDNNIAFLPMKFSVHGGVNMPLGANSYFGSEFDNSASILINYKNQGPFQQFDIGTQVLYRNVISGVGYRGIPGLRGMPNQDSIIFLLGLKLENGMVIGYSYDFMISNIAIQTKGSHEISMRYQFLIGEPRYRNQRGRILKCFDFMM